MSYTFKLVEEKQSILLYFSLGKILKIPIVYIGIVIFLSFLPYIGRLYYFWIFPSSIFMGILYFISGFIYYLKFYLKFDYNEIGEIRLYSNKIEILEGNKLIEYNPAENNIKWYYGGVRNKKYHFNYSHEIQRGISELIINNDKNYFVLLTDKQEVYRLKKLFGLWYKMKYNFSEFIRDRHSHRLIQLELNFNPKNLKWIEENCDK